MNIPYWNDLDPHTTNQRFHFAPFVVFILAMILLVIGIMYMGYSGEPV